jgi:putative FmdB family regulatory protein
MPVYEYRCLKCKKRYSALVGMTAEDSEATCPACGGNEAERLVSRFARVRSEDDRLDAIADHLETMGEPESPNEMRHLVRELGKALDDDVSDEMEEVFEAEMAEEAEEPSG